VITHFSLHSDNRFFRPLRKLRDKRQALYDEIRNLNRTRKRELDVEMKRKQIDAIESRIKSMQLECKKISDQTIPRLENQLDAEQGQADTVEVGGARV